MNPPTHYDAELHDLLDRRLDAARQAEVEAHVATCERCRRELEQLRWLKDVALKRVPAQDMPAGLEERVRATLDLEDRRLSQTSRPGSSRRAARRAIAWGVLAAAAAVAVVLLRPRESLPGAVARDFRDVRGQMVRLEIEARDPAVIEAFFSARGITFPTRVFDLAMMQYRLIGGRVHEIRGRPSALFAYRGPADEMLVCQMYQGTTAELPAAHETRDNNGITFHILREGPVTLVFWQEGDVVCVLASDAPAEDVLQLAFAKAVRV